jgi:hypothetical protein
MLCLLLDDVEGAKETTMTARWKGLQNFKFRELSGEGENVRSTFFSPAGNSHALRDRPFLAVHRFLVDSNPDLLPAFVSTKSDSTKVRRQECISTLLSPCLNLWLLTKLEEGVAKAPVQEGGIQGQCRRRKLRRWHLHGLW